MATPLVPLTMFGWIPFSMVLFNRLPIRKAIIFSFVIAWLFLPISTYAFPGIPDLTKFSATSYSVLLAVFIFDADRLKSFRIGWWDIPMAAFCFTPILTSILNGLGAYDGASASLSTIVVWGIPYFIGRLYLGSLIAIRELATGIFAGGLIYIPLCLYEIRLSPQLHRIVYGFFPHEFGQTIRYGGFRPQVFMQHGLEVGLWMLAATLVGFWFWKAGTIKKVGGIPMPPLVLILFITFVLCKSTGAWGMCVLGLLLLFSVTTLRTALPIYLIVGVIVFHLVMNTFGTAEHTKTLVESLYNSPISAERVQSLEFRFDNEEFLTAHAKKRFWFGWGGFDRNRPVDENGEILGVTDSLWIVHFGIRGMVGLIANYGFFLLPIIAVTWKCPVRLWGRPEYAPVAVMTIILLMYASDCLLNAMVNPILILSLGALSSYAFAEEKIRRRPRSRFPKLQRPSGASKKRLAAAQFRTSETGRGG